VLTKKSETPAGTGVIDLSYNPSEAGIVPANKICNSSGATHKYQAEWK
jgi:hypothetical protein